MNIAAEDLLVAITTRDLRMVLERACDFEDRTNVEQRAMLRVAYAVEVTGLHGILGVVEATWHPEMEERQPYPVAIEKLFARLEARRLWGGS